MRKITLLVLFCCTHLMMLAQTKSTNTNETPKRVKCYTTEYMAELRKANPKMQTDEQFEQFMAEAIAKRKSDIARGVVQPLAGPYVITVIVHVLHSGQPIGTYPNLKQIQIASQMRVLNEDFNRTNADAALTPTGPGVSGNFAAVAGSFGATANGGSILFQLARQDPAGNMLAEAGVHRHQIPAAANYTVATLQTIKAATSWDNSRYMNMWTVANPVSAGGGGLYGYAQFPNGTTLNGTPAGGPSSTDGLVMAADAFGSNYTYSPGGPPLGTLLPPAQRYTFSLGADKGRTATHELGHGLGLNHIWGNGAACSALGDYCNDTPIASGPNEAPICLADHPKATTCAGAGGTPEMLMNYMDYVLDGCMNLFTQDQMIRMVTVMNVSPGRNTLTAAIVGNCPAGAFGLTRPTTGVGSYPQAGGGQLYSQDNAGTIGGVANPTLATGAGFIYALGGTGLPPGLTLNTATGVISGLANASGIGNTYNFTITASGGTGVDANGISLVCGTVTVPYTISVIASTCPTITANPLAGALTSANTGTPYTQNITTIGGVGTYTYSLFSGTSLPTGFTLSPTGIITGSSAGPQTSAFTVLITDSSTPTTCSITVNYTLAVVAAGCTPTAVVSTYPYIQNFDGLTGAGAAVAPTPAGVGLVTNSTMPCGWAVYNQNGDTRTFNTYNVGFAATSANSGTNAMLYIYNTTSAADDWAITQGFAMNAGQTYNVSLQYRVSAAGATTYPENFQVRWGNAQTVAAMTAGTQLFTTPPAGATNLTYQATTPMTITPTTTGTYYIGIQVNSAADQYFLAIDDFSVTTTGPSCPPTVVSTLLPTVSPLAYTIGTLITPIQMTAIGITTGSYSYSLNGGAFPLGVTMVNGLISGTPSPLATSGSFTIRATNAGCSDTKIFTFTIAPACATTTLVPATGTTLIAGNAGTAYSRAITSNLVGAVFTATGLPVGLSISGAGVISGTPTVAATSTVVVTAAAGACSGTATYTLVIGQNLTTAINSTLSNEVKVSPNPSKADFNVDFAGLNLGKVAIRIYDAQGKQVLATSTSNNTAVISLAKFAAGMYLMEIDSQKGRILKRIVKE